MQWTEALEDEKEERFVRFFAFLFFSFLRTNGEEEEELLLLFIFGKETIRGKP